jgi:hypothetical protein
VYGSATGNGGRAIFGSANGTGGEGVIAEAHGQNGKAISGYASDASGYAGFFVGKVKIIGKMETLNTTDEVVIGTNGTPFLEIREITGTIGDDNNYTQVNNALPEGWTSNNTRILSFEIRAGFHWHSMGWDGGDAGGTAIGVRMLNNPGRDITITHGNSSYWWNQPWRAIIMKMP